jgi:chromosome segregation ATPase
MQYFSFPNFTPEELGLPASLQITHERNPGPIGLPSQPTSVNGKTRRVPEKDDNRVVDLERKLSATLAAKTERDQRLAQLTEELALKSALLEQAEANVTKATKRAGQEPRELADRLLAQTSLMEHKDAELVKMQAKLDELVLSHNQALQTATSRAAVADERSQRACEQNRQYESELAQVRAELKAGRSELEAVRSRLTEAEIGLAKSKAEADTLRALTTAGLVGTDEDRMTRVLLERIRAMESEIADMRWSEKSFEAMETRNEG